MDHLGALAGALRLTSPAELGALTGAVRLAGQNETPSSLESTGAPQPSGMPPSSPGQFDDHHWQSLIDMIMQRLGVGTKGDTIGMGAAFGNLAANPGPLVPIGFSGIYSR